MGTSADRRMTGGLRRMWYCAAILLLCIVFCCTFCMMRRFSAGERRRHTGRHLADTQEAVDNRSELDVGIDATADDAMLGLVPVAPELPLGEAERAELFSAVSNIVVAYSNNDARVVRDISSMIANFMGARGRRISAETCEHAFEPVRRALVDHFCVHKGCGDFKTAEELDERLALDMDLLLFVFETGLKWKTRIVNAHFEAYALTVTDAARKRYELESRHDMAAVCEKWVQKWQEQIDSDRGYFRVLSKRSYLQSLKTEKERREQMARAAEWSGGVMTDDEVRESYYHGVELFGRMYGYTPKWISDYGPPPSKR